MAVSEKLRKKLEKRKEKLKSGGGLGFISFKEGSTRVRVLSAGSDEDFAIEATQFYLGNTIGGVISPATFGEPCKLMETYEELKKSDDEDDAELANKLKPRRKYFIVVLKMNDKGTEVEEGPKLAIISKGIYEDMIDMMLDEEQGDFTDPKTGYDFKIKRSGSGQFDTEYSLVPCKPTKIADKKNAAPQDLTKMLKGLAATYEETEEKLNEFLGGSSSDDDDDDKSNKKSSKGKGKSKPSSDLGGTAKKKKKKKATK